MKVILNGKEIKCFNFDLKPGDVFTYVGGANVYIKTNQNTVFNVCCGAMENYANQPIVPYEDAILVLDPDKCCHKKKECDNKEV